MTHASRLLLAVGLALGGGVLSLAPSAQAAACSTTSGVTVIVSFPSGTSTGCAAGDPSSGLSALSGAGFAVAQMIQQPGFVCRINGYPSSSVDPCQRAGPQSKWTYYHARRGGSWQYGTEGAASYNPAPGSVDGWGWGGPPAVAPPAAPVTSPPKPTPKPTPPRSTPKPTRTSAPKPSPSRPGATSRSSGTTSAGRTSTGAARTTTPTTAGSSATPPPSGTGGPSSTTGSTTTATTTTAPALAGGPTDPTDRGANGSSPWPLVGGGGLVAALAAAAAYGARRRRLTQH